ncbi:DNA double-strand break repair nuclease NurA [Infirmifilum sp. SLHALR2]
MNEFLLEILAKKRELLRSRIEKTGLEEVLARARELWVEHAPAVSKPTRYGAVDGSNNSIEFKGLTFYAVLGYAIGKVGGSVVERSVGDMDILLHSDAGEHVRLLREISEVKVAALLPETELLMVDGSIISLLLRPRPLAAEPRLKYAVEKLWEKAGRDVAHVLWSGLRTQLRATSYFLYDHLVSHQVARDHSLLLSDQVELIVLLEYLEKLLATRILLEQRVIGRGTPGLVFVSKTSRSRDHFTEFENKLNRMLPPDIVIFSYASTKPGFSRPMKATIEEVKGAMPSHGDLAGLIAEFYERLDFILSYVRLVENGPVLMLEIPVDRDVVGEDRYGDVVEHVLRYLNSLAYNGYPYPLIEAHRGSLITRDDIENMAMILGLLPGSTGREVLLEWIS